VTKRQFAFGKNWQAYVRNALTKENVSRARQDFHELFSDIDLQGKTFLDIGFGQGLALFFAQEMGAKVLGIDIDKDNLDALKITVEMFEHCELPNVRIISILDESFLQEQLQRGQFDIVHSWGVLHHTGNMSKALHHSAKLVKAGGFLVLAIYNKHWSSLLWRWIKWGYNVSPAIVQRLFIYSFYPIIYVAKWIVTRDNPRKMARKGMDFFYNIIDWVGGYPYEYASIATVQELVCRENFLCLRSIPAHVPTGCNQFVFKKQ